VSHHLSELLIGHVCELVDSLGGGLSLLGVVNFVVTNSLNELSESEFVLSLSGVVLTVLSDVRHEFLFILSHKFMGSRGSNECGNSVFHYLIGFSNI
jgi:hypothetical protein